MAKKISPKAAVTTAATDVETPEVPVQTSNEQPAVQTAEEKLRAQKDAKEKQKAADKALREAAAALVKQRNAKKAEKELTPEQLKAKQEKEARKAARLAAGPSIAQRARDAYDANPKNFDIAKWAKENDVKYNLVYGAISKHLINLEVKKARESGISAEELLKQAELLKAEQSQPATTEGENGNS